MKKLISELRGFIKTQYIDDRVLSRLEPIVKKMEAKADRKPTPKKSAKFVELMDGLDCYLIRKKDISWISFKKENFTEVNLYMKNKGSKTFNVSENQEVLENLISDFKG